MLTRPPTRARKPCSKCGTKFLATAAQIGTRACPGLVYAATTEKENAK